MYRRTTCAHACLLACAATAASAQEITFSTTTWPASAGGNGLTYAVVVWPQSCSWREARELAVASGGDLASIQTAAELEFVGTFATEAGGFTCAGPWVGGFRAAGATWTWSNGTPVRAFGWEPGRPAQSGQLEAALCLTGTDAHGATWSDAMPSPDAGSGNRSAVLKWTSFTDCDGDGAPDRLEIAVDPSLDANGDGALDACTNARPEDINLDGVVNGIDLGFVLGSWGDPSPGVPRADINRDGIVDGADLGLLLSAWSA